MMRGKRLMIGALAAAMLGVTGCAEEGAEIQKTASAEPVKEETAEPVAEKAEEKKPEATPEAKPAEVHDVEKFAFFGIDDKRDEGGAADAIKIISLDKTDKKISVVSIPRDTVVYITGRYQDYGLLKDSMKKGGEEAAMETLNYNFGLDLDKYLVFDYGALAKLVDRVGGVEIELTKEEIDQTDKPLGIKGEAGVYTLNGEQAVNYTRIYKIDSDEKRMERSTKVIQVLAEKLKNASALEVMGALNDVIPFVHTNMDSAEILDLIPEVMGMDLDDIAQYRVGEKDGAYVDGKVLEKGRLAADYVAMAEEIHKMIYGEEFEFVAPEELVSFNEQIQDAFGK